MHHVLLLDMAIHTFDAARFMAGDAARPSTPMNGSRPVRGTAKASSAAAIFEFSDGAVFTYRGSWCADGCAQAGKAHGGSSAATGLLSGTGMMTSGRSRHLRQRTAFFRGVAAVGVPPLDAADRVGGHAERHAGFYRRHNGRPRTGNGRHRQYQEPCHGVRCDRQRRVPAGVSKL